METSGREFALKFHGLESGDARVRERFRSICLDQLELTDQQALDILTARATRVLCTDIAPETLQTVARSLKEIGVQVDIAESYDDEHVEIPSGSFSTDHDTTFAESQLFERVTQVRRDLDDPLDGYTSGFVEEFFSQDKHFGLFSIQDSEAGVTRRRNRHANFLRKGRTLSFGERLGLFMVICLLCALFVILVKSSRDPLHATVPASEPLPPPSTERSVSVPAGVEPPLPTSSFEGTTTREGTTISVRWNRSGKTSSVRLTVDSASPKPVGDQRGAPATFSRAESDPTFLVQESDSSWHGEAPAYISIDINGETRRVTGVARFTVSSAQDGSGAIAEVSILYPRDGSEPAGGREEALTGYTFSLHEVVNLQPSSGS